MPRLVFDFPDPDAHSPGRAVLSDPVEVVVADRVEEVRGAVDRVEEGVGGGLTAAGYLAYEAAPAFDGRMRVRQGGRMPLLWFGLFEGSGTPAPPGGRVPAGGTTELEWKPEMDRAGHAAAVRRVRDHIAAGRTYQTNLTTRLRAPFTGDPEALYTAMRMAQGGGYHALLDLGRFVIASASPELFFATRGREITTRPMKGTRPRGRWPEEDAAMESQLRTSAKDRAENLMIVDLLRNDLGRVAVPGSVRVPRLMDVERYRTVWQMTSTVTAALRDDVGLRDLLAALFPCGSVTGAPKISTMGIIADLEASPREVYCGAIGIIRPGGDSVFSVPIRTAWVDREAGEAVYGSGGGVVWDSRPEAEYDELLAKAVVVRRPWPRFSLVETLRLEDGELVRLDRHLSRLCASAAHFGLAWDEAAVRSSLAAACESRGQGRYRVRLVLEPDGGVDVDLTPLSGPAGRDAPLVAIASSPVTASDPFLYHKTSHRETYQRARAAAPSGAWDVLLWNEAGELTEFTRGNLVVERDGALWTPRREAGLLAGCLRDELLEAGAVRETSLRLDAVDEFERVWFINSLRGWIEVRVDGTGGS